MLDLSAIVKAYDIRGLVPQQLDDEVARAVGAAFVRLLDARTVVTAYDMRESSVPLSQAFAQGATSQGADVIECGLGSTDMLYYAAGSLDVPGAMFTASHNPARYNGIKLCQAGAAPVGQESGLREIRSMIEAGLPPADAAPGTITRRELLPEYARYLRGLVPGIESIRRLKVVVDAGNGMAGLTVPAVLGDGQSASGPSDTAQSTPLPLDIVAIYFELDGSFPNHEANPIDPENLRDLQAAVRREQADIGLAFDGDADRCFVVDERGELVSPSALTALIASRELAREPGSTVIHNLITSHAVPELVSELGGMPVRTRVGHSFIKAEMARTNAVFGGEHSGHFYFRDFWRADSGMLAALHTLAALGGQDQPLSAMLARYDRYAQSGEVNSEVADAAERIEAVAQRYGARPGAGLDRLDGLTVDLGNGRWFNLRPSNTEPLLRLNVEAPDEPAMAELRDEILTFVRTP